MRLIRSSSGFALGGEAIDFFAQREFDFALGFADAGEDAEFRIAAGCDAAAKLAFTDDIKAGAEAGEDAEYGDV